MFPPRPSGKWCCAESASILNGGTEINAYAFCGARQELMFLKRAFAIMENGKMDDYMNAFGSCPSGKKGKGVTNDLQSMGMSRSGI